MTRTTGRNLGQLWDEREAAAACRRSKERVITAMRNGRLPVSVRPGGWCLLDPTDVMAWAEATS